MSIHTLFDLHTQYHFAYFNPGDSLSPLSFLFKHIQSPWYLWQQQMYTLSCWSSLPVHNIQRRKMGSLVALTNYFNYFTFKNGDYGNLDYVRRLHISLF